MKKLAIFALVSVLLALPAVAQPDAGDIGVFFDVGGTQTTKIIPGFVPDFFYVLSYDLGDLTGWEASVVLSDPTWNILGATLNPGTALNVGTTGNFIVGLGLCANGAGFYTLVTYNIGYFISPVAPNDVLVCIGGSNPSSFGGAPGYSTCADDLIPFGLAESGSPDYPDGCGVINPTGIAPVGTEALSLGAVKAKF